MYNKEIFLQEAVKLQRQPHSPDFNPKHKPPERNLRLSFMVREYWYLHVSVTARTDYGHS